MTDRALSGYTVLELAQGISGPYAGGLLAGLGAGVVKVEPLGGDHTRGEGPFPDDDPHPEKSGLFLYLNMGKKSVTLDIESSRGIDIVRRLAAKTDILLESFRPGYLDSLGLGYGEMEKINPGLIMVSITGFGQTGPYKDYQSTDLISNAVSGTMAAMGDPDRPPIRTGGSIADYHVGVQGFDTALCALFSREFTGEGQHVDISAMESMIVANENNLVGWPYNHQPQRRTPNVGRVGATGIFPCKDGLVAIDIVMGNFASFSRLTDITGIEEFRNPAYIDPKERELHADEINGMLRTWCGTRTKSEIYHAGQAHRMPFGNVCTVEDLLEASQLNDREYFVEIDHPEAGALRYPGAPFKMNGTPWQAGRAPLLGEHNAEIFRDELGLTAQDVASLKQQQII